eukprot:5953113-Amphidinium_carterae.1
MDPPSEVISSWTKVGEVVAWMGMTGNVGQVDTVRGSFMALLGFGADDHLRLLAVMPATLVAAALGTWK